MTAIMNRRAANMEGPDFYPTPAWATRALLAVETIRGSVHEPCCGNGAMASVLLENGIVVEASDLFDHGYGRSGLDARTMPGPVENIVTNPPYNIAEDLLLRFHEICERKIAMLLRLSFLESKRRYPLFVNKPPSRVHIFSERLSMSAAGTVVKGGGTISYGWFIWERGYNGPPSLGWIPPGFKVNK